MVIAAGDRVGHRGAAHARPAGPHLPPVDARAAIEAFDPDRRGVWFGDPVRHHRRSRSSAGPSSAADPRPFIALEDKLLAEEIWDAAGVERAPYRGRRPVDGAALAAATRRARRASWARSGRATPATASTAGGNFVRWVRRRARPRPRRAASSAPRCDRVRVMPFLDGVPCSIHGFVLPDGTAALRPVEIAILRDPVRRRVRLRRAGHLLGPAGRRPRGDARRRPPGRRAPAHGGTPTAAPSASTAS